MDIPVLIVGAGPAGLCTSIVLSRLGVRSILVERHAGTSIYPKATGISLRTMELLRQWALDERVREASLDAVFVNSVRETTLASPQVEELTLGSPDEDQSRALSPVMPVVCAQDVFEPILLDAARGYDLARVFFNTELMSLRQENDFVYATLVDRETGDSRVVQARYVVGADGVGSAVRREVGIAMVGPANVGEYLSVLFRANLDHLAPLPVCGMYSVRAGDSTGLLLPSSRDGRWFFAAPWSPDRPSVDSLQPHDLLQLVRGAIGDDAVEIELLAHRSVIIGAQVADRFREGNVFVVGDAAHRMTPSGGTGLNTAIHGAHNLAWKLAAVLNGWAGVSLLDTYETERRPVGQRNVAKSIGKWREKSGIAVDMGIVYQSHAIMRDSDGSGEDIVEPGGPARVGGRVPHVKLKGKGWRNSTIDVSGVCLTLIADARALPWVNAMIGAARALNIPLEVTPFTPAASDAEVATVWEKAFGVPLECAVLVRPDGHIAWITPADFTNAPALCADAIARIVDGTCNNASTDTSNRTQGIGTTLMHAVTRPPAPNMPVQRRSA